MLPTKTLLDHTRELNRQIETAYIELGIALSEVEETSAWRELGYDSFPDYYQQDLGRTKSTVSKLITVGKWVKSHGFLNETNGASYTTIYESINAFPEKEPQFILEAAKTNTLSEIRAERQEKHPCLHEEVALCCTSCWKRVDDPA